MDDVIDFPKSRVKPLSENEALERLRQAGRIEGIGALAKLVGWERTRASRTVKEWERDGKVVRTSRSGHSTVIEAVVVALPVVQGVQPLMQPPVQAPAEPPALHTPAQAAQVDVRTARPVAWWRRVAGRRAHPAARHAAHPVPHAVPTPLMERPKWRTMSRPPQPQPRHDSQPLVTLAYGFFALGIGINVWNAWGGKFADVVLPAAMGVLAEGVMFYLPAWAIGLPMVRRTIALVLLVLLVVPFALSNSFRMASIISIDQTTTRANRQTEGVQTANTKLDDARKKRDEACATRKPTVACQLRQSEVTKLEGKPTEAQNTVAVTAKPEGGDFAKLVKWVSFGRLEPKLDDFDMLWLLFRTLLPQLGGLVRMLARR
jgi:hypothetical protein